MLLMLMARVPLPGQTKTRLETHLSKKECASLHRAFILDTLFLVKKAKLPFVLSFTPEEERRVLVNFLGNRYTLLPQVGADLGEKMLNCLRWGFAQGYSQVAVMGTDIPHLKTAILTTAQNLLLEHDVVLGPTPDGGYYFLGTKKLIPELFQDISWGKGQVLEQTLEVLRKKGQSYALLPQENDIDTFQDLQALLAQLETRRACTEEAFPLHTYSLLQELNMDQRG